MVASVPSVLELFDAMESTPLALAVLAALRDCAFTDPNVLPLPTVMLAPALFRVFQSARPLTATAPVVLMLPVVTTVRLEAVDAPNVRFAEPVT